MNPMIIAGAAAAVGFALAGLQTWRLGNAQEEIGALTAKFEVQIAETRQAVAVNESLNTDLNNLATTIADMIEGRRLDREEKDRLLAARDEDLVAANQLARRLQGERDDIFRGDIGCAEMGDIRVDLVCPAIAGQLRELTARGARGGGADDSGSSGGGGETPANPVDQAATLSPATG